MAEDFIELGIEGIDKMVDKHFHRVPNKVIDKLTYHPHRRRGRRGERRSDGESDSAGSDADAAYDPRSGAAHQHRRMSRSPDAYNLGYGYMPPPPNIRGFNAQDERTRRRREGLVRRSSSQPGGVRDGGRERRRRRRSLSDDRGRNTGGTGSGGGKGDGKGQSTTETVVLTLLGIAVGGLAGVAASGVMSSMEKEREGRERGENVRGSRGDNSRIDEKGKTGGGRHDQRGEGTRTKGGGTI
jgi:hypothetical protein